MATPFSWISTFDLTGRNYTAVTPAEISLAVMAEIVKPF